MGAESSRSLCLDSVSEVFWLLLVLVWGLLLISNVVSGLLGAVLGLCLVCFGWSSLLGFLAVFEVILLPMALVIWLGRSGERFQSVLYLGVFTLLFSVPFFLVWLGVVLQGTAGGLFDPFLGSFPWFVSMLCVTMLCVKFPVFLFHWWLPRAHVEAPTGGSMVLAACLLKLGSYGFVRFSCVLNLFSGFWAVLAAIGGVFACLCCFVQSDLKALVAYSSVSHMSLMFGVVSAQSESGVFGLLLLSLSHGLVSALLFMLVGLCYDAVSSRSFMCVRKFSSRSFMVAWLVVCFLNASLPPFLGFWSDVFLLSVFSWWWGLMAVVWLLLVLGGGFCYFLFLVSKSKTSAEAAAGGASFEGGLLGVIFMGLWAALLWGT